jgi:hypothetical protein
MRDTVNTMHESSHNTPRPSGKMKPEMKEIPQQIMTAAGKISQRYASIELVEAVVLGGSWSERRAEKDADIDLYVYSRSPLPIGLRTVVAQTESTRVEIDNRFWEPGDEWIDLPSQKHVDAMFRTQRWIEERIDRVLERYEASVGYSTCFWHNVLTSRVLFDRSGWFGALQARTRQPYPWQLKGAIISKNYPLLRDALSSYRHQLEQAIRRCDEVGINHRVTSFTASLIDILFAVNELPHPGEKRLHKTLEEQCGKLPVRFAEDLKSLYRAAANNRLSLLAVVDHLVDRLEDLLRAEGLL